LKVASVGFSEPSETPKTKRFAGFVEQLQQRAFAEPGAIPTDPQGRELADWTVRVVATSVDVIVLSVAQGIFKNLHLGSTALFVIDWLMGIGYLTAGAWGGCTLGNLVTKTKVVDANSGEVLRLRHALLRTFALVGLLVTLIGAGVDVLLPLIDGRRQSLHDKAGSSLVIRTGRIFAVPGSSSLGEDHGT